MLLGDSHIKVPVRVFGLKPVQSRAVGHRPGDGHDPGIVVRQFRQMVGENLTEGRLTQGLGLPGLRIVGAKAVKFLLLGQGRLEPFPLGCDHVQNDREILGFEEFKHLDQAVDIVPVDRAVIGHSKLLENHAGEDHPLHMLFRPTGHFQGLGSAELLDEVGRPLVQMNETTVGSDFI